VDAAVLACLLRAHTPDRTLVEEIWGLPPLRASRTGAPVRAGTTSTFSFGESCGVVRGVLAAFAMSVRYVPPQTWRTKAGLTGQGKDASRGVAARLHPEVADQLTRQKDHGRADAILIARAGMAFTAGNR
jgi:crossover junction endodeoxyribonuclease RuvC